jgi:hypothetical protein
VIHSVFICLLFDALRRSGERYADLGEKPQDDRAPQAAAGLRETLKPVLEDILNDQGDQIAISAPRRLARAAMLG